VRDAPEYMLGVEALGPRLGDVPTLFRLGGRQRTLPFGLAGAEVRERAYSAGAGLPFAGGRALFDLALQRAARSLEGTTTVDARERAWTVSVGLTVRP
jgi:hypothetical protein